MVRRNDVKVLSAVLFAALTLGFAAPALAAPMPWAASTVRGTVVYLAAGRWEEVVRDQDLSGATIRTLRSGHLNIDGGQILIEVSPSTTLELGTVPGDAAPSIKQYLGSVKIAARAGTQKLSLQAGGLSITSITGEAQVLVTGEETLVVVASGKVWARRNTGEVVSVSPGSYAADENGTLVASSEVAAKGQANSTGQGNALGKAGGDGAGSGGEAGGNGGGNGNGGGAGNAGGGNAGGNAGGGNAGGGNAGGNGNGNGGGNGNGNGGGNGNGNGKQN